MSWALGPTADTGGDGLRARIDCPGPGPGGPCPIFGKIASAAEDVGGAVVDAADFVKEDVAPIAGAGVGFAVGGPGGAAAGGSLGQSISKLGEGGAQRGNGPTVGDRISGPAVRGVQRSLQRFRGTATGAQVGAEAGSRATGTRQQAGTTLDDLASSPLAWGALAAVLILVLGG